MCVCVWLWLSSEHTGLHSSKLNALSRWQWLSSGANPLPCDCQRRVNWYWKQVNLWWYVSRSFPSHACAHAHTGVSTEGVRGERRILILTLCLTEIFQKLARWNWIICSHFGGHLGDVHTAGLNTQFWFTAVNHSLYAAYCVNCSHLHSRTTTGTEASMVAASEKCGVRTVHTHSISKIN